MSQYMQESSYINPYYGTTAGQSACGANSGSDSPTATAAALAAYYGSSASFPSTGSAAASGYASYYNYMAATAGSFYPTHQSSYSYGAPGSGATGAAGVTPTADDYTRKHAQQPLYTLNTALPPPSIVEPGTNSLDDVLKTPSKKNPNRDPIETPQSPHRE